MRFYISMIIACLFLFSHTVEAKQTSSKSKQVTNILVQKIEKKLGNNIENQILFLKQVPPFIERKVASLKNLTPAKKEFLAEISKDIYEEISRKEFQKKQIIESKKFTSIPAYNSFLKVAENDEFFFLENNVWYTYNYTAGRSFPTNADITQVNLDYSWVNPAESVLLYHKPSSKVMIVEKKYYIKQRIVNNDIIYGVSDKYTFLKRLKKDLYFKNNSNTDLILTNIQNIADSLSKGKNKDETIEAFYGFVLDRMKYSQNLSVNKIYSWLEWFTSGDGVCESYAASFEYLLWLSWFADVEFMPGDVIDSTDFPNIGHAWVRIGDKYYDPTFDDPVGATETRKPENYRYFGLPRDLFYTNRYDLWETPEKFKTQSIEYREKQVRQNLAMLTKKYPAGKYPLLREFEFRAKYGFNQFETISPEKLEKIFKNYYVVSDYKIENSSSKKLVRNIQFFQLNDTANISIFLDQIFYDINGYQLFKWKLPNGWYDYRVSNDFTVE